MSGRVTSPLLLVGSLPVASADDAFGVGAELFGELVPALPDGESGPRAAWVGYERERLVRPSPDVVTVRETRSPTGIPRHAYDTPEFALREGARNLRLGPWPRIDDAIASYAVFTAKRAAGTIPAGIRFQVCLPFPFSALNGFKVDFAHDYPIAAVAFEELCHREIARLLDAVPAEELAIQWDVAYEVLDLEGVIAWTSGGAWERFARGVERLSHDLPDEVLVGYHLCYGTFPEWPMYEARDLALLVEMANHAVASTGRRVDWLHLAGPRYLRSEDDRFFAPLEHLRVGDTRVFLGIILPIDGEEGLLRRHGTASRHLEDFGVAMYCGFGRQPGSDPWATMAEHARLARLAASLR